MAFCQSWHNSVALQITTGIERGIPIYYYWFSFCLRTRHCYISYWRMMSPSGEMFGEWIWLLIKVDTSLLDSLSDLKVPPLSNAKPKIQIIDMNTVPVDVEDPQNLNCDKNADSVKSMVDEVMSEKELDVDRLIDVDGSGSSNSVLISPEVAPALPSYPVIPPPRILYLLCLMHELSM